MSGSANCLQIQALRSKSLDYYYNYFYYGQNLGWRRAEDKSGWSKDEDGTQWMREYGYGCLVLRATLTDFFRLGCFVWWALNSVQVCYVPALWGLFAAPVMFCILELFIAVEICRVVKAVLHSLHSLHSLQPAQQSNRKCKLLLRNCRSICFQCLRCLLQPVSDQFVVHSLRRQTHLLQKVILHLL